MYGTIFISQWASLHFAFGSDFVRSLARFQETAYATASEASLYAPHSGFANTIWQSATLSTE